MKNSFLIFLVVCLSGCGVFKKVYKESTLDKTETFSIVKSDSIVLITDKSVITVKEKLDTVISVAGATINQDIALNMDSLIKGLTAVKNDLLEVRLILNPVTHILSVEAYIKPKEIPVKIYKEVTTQNNVIQKTGVSNYQDTRNKEVHELRTVSKELKEAPWIRIVTILLIFLVVWLIYKNRKCLFKL